MSSQGSDQALPMRARRAKRENGVWGRIPQAVHDLLTGDSDLDASMVQALAVWSLTVLWRMGRQILSYAGGKLMRWTVREDIAVKEMHMK